MPDIIKTRDNLRSIGFEAHIFDTKDDAAAYLNEHIDGKSVGFGGSKTLESMGLYESLGKHNEVVWHWKVGVDPDNVDSIVRERDNAMHTDIYISSANALAESGEIVNMDGSGNRVSSTLWGHKKVIFVVGSNKIVPTYDDAIWRTRNVAAPKRAQSTSAKTPCAIKADKCYDCKSPGRICRGLVSIFRPMMMQEFEVILINEELGF